MNKIEEWVNGLDESMDIMPHVFDDKDNLKKCIKIIEHLMKAVEYYSQDEKRMIRELWHRDSAILHREYLTFDTFTAKEAIEACENIIKEEL